jgi:hypothetical protein
MSILSEGKGVMMWLKKRGNDPHFSGYLLKLFNKETGITFHRISFTSCDGKRFQRFTTWYGKQDIPQLKKEFAQILADRKKKAGELFNGLPK